MDKKWMIPLCIFSVLTFISSIVSTTLVFYSERAHTKINSSTVLAANNEYKSTSIIYYQSNDINLSSLNPGDVKTYSFEIVNNNSNTVKYSIKWQNVNSTWYVKSDTMETHPEEFVYSLTCSDGNKVENQTMPDSKEDKVILTNKELKTSKTNTCQLTITFVNKNIDQSYNLNKIFGGTFKVIVEE